MPHVIYLTADQVLDLHADALALVSLPENRVSFTSRVWEAPLSSWRSLRRTPE